MSIETGWHFSAKGGSSIGPVSLDRIRRAVNSGELQLESMVWHPSLGDWKLIRDVREVRQGSTVTPPPIVDQPVMSHPVDRNQPVVDGSSGSSFNVNAEKLKDVKGWSFWRYVTEKPESVSDHRIWNLMIAAFMTYAFFLLVMIYATAKLMLSGDLSVVSSGDTSVLNAIISTVFAPIVGTIAAAFYVAPWGIAYVRQHRNLIPIAIVNITFGWMLLGWIGALAWAFSDQNKS